MIKIQFDKYGKIRNLDFGDEVIFKGSNRVNQIFVTFDDVAYNPNHYMTYSALINENDYEGDLTDLATAKTTIDGVEGYTFYLFSNLTSKAGELKLSVRLVDRTTERVLVSGVVSLVVEDTAISTYASVDITKTQYNALLTAFDELSQSIDSTNFKTINGESIYGEGDIVVLTSDVMVYYVGQEISAVNDSLGNLYGYINELRTENAELYKTIEKQEKKINQLELASEGNILSTITESDSAYEVGVGVDTLPYATIDKIGGMTYKSNNLLVLDDVPPTALNGITYSVKDGIITINGTTTAGISVYIPVVNQKENVAYNLRAFFEGTKPNKTIFCYARNEAKQQLVAINNNAVYASFTPTTAIAYFNFYCDIGVTFDNFVIKPILVSGTTPASAWEKGFIGLRNSKVTEILSAGANLLNSNSLITKDGTFTKQSDKSYISKALGSYGTAYFNCSWNSSVGAMTSVKGIPLKKGTYYISFKAKLNSGTNAGGLGISITLENDKNIIGGVVNNPTISSYYQEYKRTFTLSGDESIGVIVQTAGGATSAVIQIKDIMISKADIEYKPYKQPTAIAIPTAIQNLDGYGIGVDATYYNYVDFENKKFVRNVKKIVLDGSSDEVYGVSTADNGNGIANFSITFSSLGLPNYIANGAIDWYIANREEQLTTQANTTTEGVYLNTSTLFIRVKSTTANTISQLRTYLANNPVIVIYAVETPVAEGLSHIIDGEILTEVESGGTLTFENEYKQDVPFTWTFQERL